MLRTRFGNSQGTRSAENPGQSRVQTHISSVRRSDRSHTLRISGSGLTLVAAGGPRGYMYVTIFYIALHVCTVTRARAPRRRAPGGPWGCPAGKRQMEAGKGHASRSSAIYLGIGDCQESNQPRNGYFQSAGGDCVSLMVRGETHRRRLRALPALSFVPLARAPPNGCCPTTAPVGLSLM